MGEETHKRFTLADKSFSGLIKKQIREIASVLNFSEKKSAEVDIIVSEIITNLLKHATKGGELLVRVVNRDNFRGLEVIGLDSGPGMKEARRMTADGVSTAKTLGHGLGSIYRLSDEFDLYSLPGWGTIVLSRVWETGFTVKKKRKYELGAIIVPKEGEEVSGDAFTSFDSAKYLKVAVFDGLGHGPNAHEAAEAAVKSYKKNFNLFPDRLISATHNDIRKTRGVVGLFIHINKLDDSCTYSGVGNITGKCFSRQETKNLISYNGTMGHVIPNTINNHVLDLSEFNMILVQSDGLKSRWELEKHPTILNHHPSTIAACIYNEQVRGTDDATVVVVKINRKFL